MARHGLRTLSGEIAQPDGTLTRGQITFSDRIVEVHAAPTSSDDYILPGFVDLQVNGAHGAGVMTASPDAIVGIGRKLAPDGTTAWLPTAVTATVERIEQVHAAIAQATSLAAEQKGPAVAATILGMHLEGPFISPRRLGAHPPLNLEPRGEAFERLRALPALKLVTLASELPGALDAIKQLTGLGVAVSLGHTDATLEEARAGVAAGARMFTHVCNAMRPLNHRDPGVVALALAPSAARSAFIPDGVHVHPEVLRLAWRARGTPGIVLTTDMVPLAGTGGEASWDAGSGRARIDRGAARLADGTLAGSIISMLDGVRLMQREVGVPLAEAAIMASTNPAAVLGLRDRGQLVPSCWADLIVLNRALELRAVFVAGRELS
jgi:N-acetylglucosamine-6-phosphate deacetylase